MQPTELTIDRPAESALRFALPAPTVRPARQSRATRSFLIRLGSWEYWPFSIVYLPVFVYWLYLSLKARSFFFFSAVNPSIESGGLLGESKIDILDRISEEFKPKTLFVAVADALHTVWTQMDKRGITFPIIAKPDAGERGWGVEKIEHWEGLVNYAQQSPVDFLIQEYVDYSLELGVFYYRMPGETRGTISSIVQKEFLSVTGNGHDSIDALIRQNDRAFLQLDALTAKFGDSLHRIPAPGEPMLLMPIGNHCRGTTFLNANPLITPDLERLFDRISHPIDGFYYGRYDLRCRSLADLRAGRHIRILELNGAGAEPAHIYQPGFSIWTAWCVLLNHWRVLYEISRENHRRGIAYMTFAEARTIYRRIQTTKTKPN